MKYYEVNDSDENGSSLPEAHFCHEYKASGAPLSGVALLPPQSLDVAGVEVARLLRLTCSTVEPGATVGINSWFFQTWAVGLDGCMICVS